MHFIALIRKETWLGFEMKKTTPLMDINSTAIVTSSLRNIIYSWKGETSQGFVISHTISLFIIRIC